MKPPILPLTIIGLIFLAQPSPAQSPLPPEVAAVVDTYETAVREKVLKPHTAAEFDLQVGFVAALQRAQEAAQQTGNLAEAVAIQTERERMGKGEAVPATDAADTPDSVKRLRATYREALARLEANRDAATAPLRKVLVSQLEEITRQLTREGRLDAAQAADRLAKSPPTLGLKSDEAKARETLARRIEGTKWQWSGSSTHPLLFGNQGIVAMADWERKGLVTGWKVTGPLTVTLHIIEGRSNQLEAVLEFAQDLRTYTGKNFDGRELPASQRIE